MACLQPLPFLGVRWTSGSLILALLGVILSPQRSRWEKGSEHRVGSRASGLKGEARGSEGPVGQRIPQTPTKPKSTALTGVLCGVWPCKDTAILTSLASEAT